MKIKLFRILIVIYFVIAVFLPVYQYMMRCTCVVITSPAFLMLREKEFAHIHRRLERETQCFCRVFTDSDDKLSFFLHKYRPQYVITTGERLNTIQTVRDVVPQARLATVLYNTPPMEFDVDMTVTPDYDKIEKTMQFLYEKLPPAVRLERKFVFISGNNDAPFSLLSQHQKDVVGIATFVDSSYLFDPIFFYADPSFLGLFPGIIERFRKDFIGSVAIMPIIKVK